MARPAHEQKYREWRHLVREVGYLADEVRLLAINLAIALAKIHNRDMTLSEMEPQFMELISKATDASQQVADLIRGMAGDPGLVGPPGLPQEREGEFARMEKTLDRIYELSQLINRALSDPKRPKRVG